eukprot:459896-Prymnesium_polylepis.3
MKKLKAYVFIKLQPNFKSVQSMPSRANPYHLYSISALTAWFSKTEKSLVRSTASRIIARAEILPSLLEMDPPKPSKGTRNA